MMFVCTLFPPGFNPVWEETLSFTLHMAEVVLVRFLVWDHDPIGRDFIGQRTVAFSSLMPGKCSSNIYCVFYCFFLLQQYCTNVDLWLMCFPNFFETGYRHVYLEGLTEASIFVHVSVHDVYGKVRSVLSCFCFLIYLLIPKFVHQA